MSTQRLGRYSHIASHFQMGMNLHLAFFLIWKTVGCSAARMEALCASGMLSNQASAWLTLVPSILEIFQELPHLSNFTCTSSSRLTWIFHLMSCHHTFPCMSAFSGASIPTATTLSSNAWVVKTVLVVRLKKISLPLSTTPLLLEEFTKDKCLCCVSPTILPTTPCVQVPTSSFHLVWKDLHVSEKIYMLWMPPSHLLGYFLRLFLRQLLLLPSNLEDLIRDKSCWHSNF